MRHESQRTYTIRDADKHHAFLGKLLAAVDRNRRGAAGKSAPIDPNQHGQTIAGRLRRGPHVEIQAILAGAGTLRSLRFGLCIGGATALHARRCKLVGLNGAGPFGGRLRRTPPQISDGRCAERDTPINREAVRDGPLNQAAFRLHRRGGGACQPCRSQERQPQRSLRLHAPSSNQLEIRLPPAV